MMNIGDLVKWKHPAKKVSEFESKIGIVVKIGPPNLLASRKLSNGVFVHWPGHGVYWSPMVQLEVISAAG